MCVCVCFTRYWKIVFRSRAAAAKDQVLLEFVRVSTTLLLLGLVVTSGRVITLLLLSSALCWSWLRSGVGEERSEVESCQLAETTKSPRVFAGVETGGGFNLNLTYLGKGSFREPR